VWGGKGEGSERGMDEGGGGGKTWVNVGYFSTNRALYLHER